MGQRVNGLLAAALLFEPSLSSDMSSITHSTYWFHCRLHVYAVSLSHIFTVQKFYLVPLFFSSPLVLVVLYDSSIAHPSLPLYLGLPPYSFGTSFSPLLAVSSSSFFLPVPSFPNEKRPFWVGLLAKHLHNGFEPSRLVIVPYKTSLTLKLQGLTKCFR